MRPGFSLRGQAAPLRFALRLLRWLAFDEKHQPVNDIYDMHDHSTRHARAPQAGHRAT